MTTNVYEGGPVPRYQIPFDSKAGGSVFIVNNVIFDCPDFPERKASHKNAKDLEKLLRELKFYVKICENTVTFFFQMNNVNLQVIFMSYNVDYTSHTS